jgi:hypothetical protein
MTQVGGQIRKGDGEISAMLHPAFQAVNGKRMAHIMKAWSFTPAAVRDPCLPEKSAEVVIDPSFGVSTAVGSEKKGMLGLLEGVHRLHADAAPCSKRWAHGNKPVFVEFAISDGQRPFLFVYIAHRQVKRFRYAKPASVEHPIEQREDKMAMRGAPHGQASINPVKKSGKFSLAKKIGFIRRRLSYANMVRIDVGIISRPDHVPGQHTNEPDPAALGIVRLPRLFFSPLHG